MQTLKAQSHKRFFPFTFAHNNARAAVQILRPMAAVTFATRAANDPPPIDQQLADAFNSNNAVMAYTLGLVNSTLPTLSPEPAWYNAFVDTFSDAKTHAMSWQQTVTPGLIAIPTGIVNYAVLWTLNMNIINQALPLLVANPGNTGAAQAVLTSLQAMLQGVTQLLSTASTFQQTIDNFAGQLTSDAANMAAAITNAEATIGYDQTQVAQLLADVGSLQNQIATWQTVETAAAIAAGVGFFAGAVIAIFTFGAGLAFGILAAAAGIATMIAASAEIKRLTAKIAVDQAEMSDLNLQIGTLSVLQQSLTSLITLSQAASVQVGLIIQAWQAMEQELTQVITDLNAAQNDLGALNLVALQADLSQATGDWQTLQSFCSVMSGISYNQANPPVATLSAS